MALGYCQVCRSHEASKNTTQQGRSAGQADGNNRSPTCKKAPALQHKALVIRHYAQGSLNVFRTATIGSVKPSALPMRTEAT